MLSKRLGVPRAVSIFLVSMVTNVVFTVGLLLVAVNVFCAALRVAHDAKAEAVCRSSGRSRLLHVSPIDRLGR